MKKNIIIVGFMGTGKTTVGLELARKLSWKYVDTDHQIENTAQMKIPQIFEKQGEDAFRELETKVIRQTLADHTQIISTGGGAVLRSENRDIMLKNGFVVALTASPEAIIARVSENENRPLLQGNVRNKVITLLEERKEAYDFAHAKIDTTHHTPQQLVAKIISQWTALANRHES